MRGRLSNNFPSRVDKKAGKKTCPAVLKAPLWMTLFYGLRNSSLPYEEILRKDAQPAH